MKVRVLASAVLPVLVACAAAPPPAPPPAPKVAASAVAPPPAPPAVNDEDFAWLEDVNGERSIAFAKTHNALSEGQLTAEPGFKALEERLAAIYLSKDKIPAVHVENGKLRNFWTDKEHPRGVWRETTLAEYKKAAPAWTTLLDVDALNKSEGQSYVYKGAQCLRPLYKRCLVSLSKGGGDATIVRELDTDKKDFVKGGFELPEGKHDLAWKDESTIYVGTDYGPGSLTRAGYARVSKEWKRGTPLSAAKTVFEGKETDNGATCGRTWDHKNRFRDFCTRSIDFERKELHFREGDKLVRVDKPEDADFGVRDDDVFIRVKSDWTPVPGGKTYKNGTLLTTKYDAYRAGKRDFQVLFEPTARSAFAGWTSTRNQVVLTTLNDVRREVTVFKRANEKAPWVGTPMKESAGSIVVQAYDHWTSDDVWIWLEDFTVPSTLSLGSLVTGKREELKKMPSFFEADGLETTQHFATSKDGTKVPYFEVGKKGRAAGATLLEAYGGFGLSQQPGYRASVGAGWLERGGTFVLANIRGGGEYGPEWHHAAMKEKRQNAYDDFIAVAEDLVARGVATKQTLGILGGSNGGLLTSVMLTQRPELFGAVVSRVPLTDMKRYHKLLAGASWMGEYGDPDKPEEWAALARYSPFQNVKREASYPPVLYTTSTKDDRVHPGHARKMVAKLEALGHKPLYYENIEGGHGGAADRTQAAHVDALIYTFLATRLGLEKK
ncbi:MAG: S9 family peptidase [Labilithrix sp.]|nr:S9 family peptidase [Labilithrix sp.]MCW5814069.1 S9 family peptidase [Labilithrix sp.]